MAALQALVAADRIELAEFERAVAQLLAARDEAQLSAIVRALPTPATLTPADRRLTEPLKIRGGTDRLRLRGRWQVARQTRDTRARSAHAVVRRPTYGSRL